MNSYITGEIQIGQGKEKDIRRFCRKIKMNETKLKFVYTVFMKGN